MKFKSLFPYIIILFALVAIRLSILNDSNLILDGDEALVGLMAKHTAEGKLIPTYFYGQQYGFSGIEAISASLLFKLFGISDINLKISSLLIWVIGVFFFYGSLVKMNKEQKWLALILVLILAISPTWLYWSMKSRGGYITSFTLSSVLIWMVLTTQKLKSNSRFIIIGLLLSLLSQSNLLWFIAFIPFLLYRMIRSWKTDLFRKVIPAFTISLVVLFIFKYQQPNVWNPNLLRFFDGLLERIVLLPSSLIHHFSGTYYLGSLKEMKVWTHVFAVFSLILLTLTILYILIKLFKKQLRTDVIAILFGFVSLLTLSLILLSGTRYLLPVQSLMLLLFFLIPLKRIVKYVLSISLLSLGLVASIFGPFQNKGDVYQFETQFTKKSMTDLTSALNINNIQYGFCPNGMGQWLIMFYSKEQTILRYKIDYDRVPEYVKMVNDQYINNDKTALIILKPEDRRVFNYDDLIIVNERISLKLNPTIEELKMFGFETKSLE